MARGPGVPYSAGPARQQLGLSLLNICPIWAGPASAPTPASPQTGHTVSIAKLIPRSQGRGPRAHELRSLLWQSSGPAPATTGTGLNLTWLQYFALKSHMWRNQITSGFRNLIKLALVQTEIKSRHISVQCTLKREVQI